MATQIFKTKFNEILNIYAIKARPISVKNPKQMQYASAFIEN